MGRGSRTKTVEVQATDRVPPREQTADLVHLRCSSAWDKRWHLRLTCRLRAMLTTRCPKIAKRAPIKFSWKEGSQSRCEWSQDICGIYQSAPKQNQNKAHTPLPPDPRLESYHLGTTQLLREPQGIVLSWKHAENTIFGCPHLDELNLPLWPLGCTDLPPSCTERQCVETSVDERNAGLGFYHCHLASKNLPTSQLQWGIFQLVNQHKPCLYHPSHEIQVPSHDFFKWKNYWTYIYDMIIRKYR